MVHNDFLETETGKKALNIADVGSYVPEDIQDFLHKLRFAHRTRIREEASDLLKKYSWGTSYFFAAKNSIIPNTLIRDNTWKTP